MNPLRFLILVVVLAPGAAFAQPKATYTSPELLPTKLKGEVFDHVLEVKNDGDQTLTIERVSPKCPCARITDFPKSIEPGQTGQIKMTIDSGRIALGRHEKKINLLTNAFPRRQIYWFRIEVLPAFALQPEQPKVAGLFSEKKTASVLVSKASEDFEILEAKAKKGTFKVESVQVVHKGVQYRVNLSAPAAATPGKAVDELVLKLRTPSGRDITTEIGTVIEHQRAVICEPNDRLFWGNKETDALLVEGAKPIGKSVVVRAVAPSVEFKVKSVRLEGKGTDAFETEIQTKTAGSSYVVQVRIKEYSKQTYVKGKLIIETDEPGATPREIEVMAMFGKRRG